VVIFTIKFSSITIHSKPKMFVNRFEAHTCVRLWYIFHITLRFAQLLHLFARLYWLYWWLCLYVLHLYINITTTRSIPLIVICYPQGYSNPSGQDHHWLYEINWYFYFRNAQTLYSRFMIKLFVISYGGHQP